MLYRILKWGCLCCFMLFPTLQAGWLPPEQVSPPSVNASRCRVAVDQNGNATAVWVEFTGINQIIQASTKPFGGSWQVTPDNLSQPSQSVEGPSIAVDSSGNATVAWVWYDGTNNIVQASTKPFGGSWQVAPDNLSQPGRDAEGSRIAVDSSGNATVVWDRYDGTNNIVQASTKLYGGSWQATPDNLSQPGQDADGSSVAVDSSGNATAVWVRYDGTNLIAQASTKPFGGSWQVIPDNLSQPGQDVGSVNIAVDSSGNATAIWIRSDGTNNIVQASTKPFGGSWQATPDNLSQPGQDASSPDIAVDSSGNATAVWIRYDGSNYIIQTLSKPLGGSWQGIPDAIAQLQALTFANPLEIALDPADNATALWLNRSGGNGVVQSANKFSLPVVTGVNPNVGPEQGGISVTITGTNFVGVTAVNFGSTSSSSFTVNSPTSITAISPGGLGTVDITVIAFGGTSSITSHDQYTYQSQPPLPPSKFRGTVKKKKHFHKHKYHLKAKWIASSSPNVEFYRIYKRSKIVDTVHANSKFAFKVHLLWKSSTKKFKITAVNSNNIESSPRKLKIKK